MSHDILSIVWLSSYPKSGNTWLRALLSNYLSVDDQPVSINQLAGGSVHIDRHYFDEVMGLSSADMTGDEIAHYRPIFHQELLQHSTGPQFVKTHDAFPCQLSGQPLYPAGDDSAAIYLIRNPLDVLSSFAHHRNKSVDETLEFMADRDSILRGGSADFDQHLGSWSDHVAGWTDQRCIKSLVIRYEDMIADTAGVFRKIIEFSGLDYNAARFQQAVQFANFKTLQQDERDQGFSEKQPSALSFFRSGQAGGWEDILSPCQVDRIIAHHSEVMHGFGYI